MLIGVGVGAEEKKKVWGNGFSCLPVSVSGAPMLFSNAQVLTGRGSGDPNPPNHPNDWICPKRTEAPRHQCCLGHAVRTLAGSGIVRREGLSMRCRRNEGSQPGSDKQNPLFAVWHQSRPGWSSALDFRKGLLMSQLHLPFNLNKRSQHLPAIAHMPSISNFHHHRFQQNENPSGVSVNIADSHSAAKGSTPLGGV